MVDMEPPTKKRKLFGWLMWWIIDDDELIKQVTEYDTLKFYRSARGISVLLLLFSAVVTILFVVFLEESAFVFIDVVFFLFFSLFIYKGKRWAMIGAMILWTFEKIMTLLSNPIIAIIWWAVYMHAFYLAFKVEGARILMKNTQRELQPLPSTPPVIAPSTPQISSVPTNTPNT